MKISKLVEDLRRMQLAHGDVEVTCTGSLLGQGYYTSDLTMMTDIFETIVENVVFNEKDGSVVKTNFGKRVKICL